MYNCRARPYFFSFVHDWHLLMGLGTTANETVTFRYTAEFSTKFPMRRSYSWGWGWGAKSEVHTKYISSP